LFTLFVVPAFYMLLAADHHGGRQPADDPLLAGPDPTTQV
jgi:multidrug efflux pump